MTEAEKQDVIKKVYNTAKGLGSMRATYQEAKEKLDSITQKDVKDWFDRNVEKKTKMRGGLHTLPQKPAMNLKWMYSICPKATRDFKNTRWVC